MRNRKGFTLIELLAVIVILAVIALIVVPTVTGIIEQSRFSSAENSINGYVSSVNNAIALSLLDANKGINIPANNALEYGVDDDELAKAEVNGKVPDYAYMEVSKDKIVTVGHFCINKYNIDYNNGKTSKSTNNYCAFATVTSVSITDGNQEIEIGDTLQLTATVEASEETGVIWTSSDSSIVSIDSNGLITGTSLGEATITAKAGIKKATINVIVKMNDSLIGQVKGTTFSNDTINNIIANNTTYSAHVYNYDGNKTWDSLTFGNANDVGASGTYAKNMVIVKVNGDLTINSGALITTYNSSYGGPKGFLLYVSGKLTNNGTISMTARGAYATGQNVYLWQNTNGTYEYVPATGASGGGSVKGYSGGAAGIVGTAATGRQTGGGGSGAAWYNNLLSGTGSTGTSYSGGTGGGGHSYASSTTSGINGASNGGAGGIGQTNHQGNAAGGGAGNPGSTGHTGSTAAYSGSNGTGGLLIIYATDFVNNNVISSNGSNGGSTGAEANGGASGGGSINIFYKNQYANITVISSGGTGYGSGVNKGGNGGAGSITIGSLKTGTFVKN